MRHIFLKHHLRSLVTGNLHTIFLNSVWKTECVRDFSINSRYKKQSGIYSLDVTLLEFFNILILFRGSRMECFVVQSVVENEVQMVYHIL